MPQQWGSLTEENLYELILSTDDLGIFLDEFARSAVEHFAGIGTEMLCGITLLRPKKSITVASSSEKVLLLDETRYLHADGPCLTACRTGSTVLIHDVGTDPRWPGYLAEIAGRGIGSMLAVPFNLRDGDQSALNLYAGRPAAFEQAAVEAVQEFTARTSLALRLAVSFGKKADLEANLRATLDSRTTIDLAVGIIMAQNRCRQEEAVKMIHNASSTRNLKMREVAARIVAQVGRHPADTHFED
jgi:GAF domain-containing protein